ncbi:Permease [Limosilactobacillus gastricus DSM 16045]|uniref:Probable membrane transporter protein n=1 Tax=Limosilactobacillus gastricus DSM 16045 TaxID=1423749 RepID=A0A0R1VP01_9LACO|nr:sulfite exporter TauE/SafE family protein [Limosilactobacillus gastricus]KRM03404.1 Permease [Limosilactobacillus gastricus DSM 16045]
MQVFGLVIIGILIGTFVIAMGGGGGAFYLGVLTALFGLSPVTAAATSLVTALPSIYVGVIGYWRHHRINFKIGNQMLIAAIPGVVLGLLLSPWIPEKIYTWIIALLLIYFGIKMLMRRTQQRSPQHPQIAALTYGSLGGLMVGISGSSGGGPIIAGLLLMGESLFDATATSSYVLAGMCSLGALVHAASGMVDWSLGIPLMIGAVIGGLFAPTIVEYLDRYPISEQILRVILALMLIFFGFKSLF